MSLGFRISMNNQERKTTMKFNEWVRKVINTQARVNGNSVALDDFSKDGNTEYSYPKTFSVNGDTYSWDVSTAHTKNRHLCTHYELWFSGAAFGGTKRIATGTLTLGKLRKGLKEIYNYYYASEGTANV